MKIINEFLAVKKSGIHRRGVFSRKNIPKGMLIVEYTGRKISKKEGARIDRETSKKGYTYIFELDKKWDIDGDHPGNGAKYINHSCDPNCKIRYTKGHIWIAAKRSIKKGEELSYNYGFDFKDYEKHRCICGSKKCVGYILDEGCWPMLKKITNSRKKANK